MQNSLILASGSPRRRELLSLMGITYQICPADVDEHMTGAPDEVVLLEVENSADVQKVVDILQKAVDEGAVESEGTDEAITAAWKDNASITTDGNYICLAVFMNGVSIPAEFMLP